MIERAIANWLTNVNELGYTIPFCEVLVSEGYSILHISRGGPGEHGKDIVARARSGQLKTFQLKGGDITLKKWRDIRGEVEDLVRLPASLPSVAKDEPHSPCLVTNGEIVGDAAASIKSYATVWAKSGAPMLEVVSGGELLRRFVDAHGRYLPTSLEDFRWFIELYVAKHDDVLPREEFARFLETLVSGPRIGDTTKKQKRAIESMVLIGSYLIEGYERAANHIAVAMGWTIVATVLMHVAQRASLTQPTLAPSLKLAWEGLDRALTSLEGEVLSRPDFVAPQLAVVEPLVYGTRALMVLGWLSAAQLLHARRTHTPARDILAVFRRELRHHRFLGEADWPHVMAIALFLARSESSTVAEHLVGRWVDTVVRACRQPDRVGFPSPYWLPERVLELRGGFLPRHEEEQFGKNTYTALSAADMLVRRMCRQRIAASWPALSRLAFCDFSPREPADWFVWRASTGDVRFEHPTENKSWSAWRTQAATWERNSVPSVLLANPDWVLPFALTYPQRANRSICAMLDGVLGELATAV